MNPPHLFCFLALLLALPPAVTAVAEEEGPAPHLAELDRYWAEVARAVGEGDFETYAASCHPEGILVSGIRGNSEPLASALVRWKKEFVATKAGTRKSSLALRFSQRVGGPTTAHETGIFRYAFQEEEGEPQVEHIHFEALLTKKDGRWLILMEFQKAVATEDEWEALD